MNAAEDTPPPANGATHTAATGETFQVAEPLRPDLKPGETVTAVPDRWCDKCEEARGVKRCPVCRLLTRPNTVNAGADMAADADDRPDPQVRFTRPLGARPVPPRDDQGDDFNHEPPRVMRTAPPARRIVHEIEPEPVPARSRRFQPPPAGLFHRSQSMRNAGSRIELDDEGREVHRTGAGGRRARDPLDELEALWEQAKVDQTQWVMMACAFAAAGMDAEKASDQADHLYAELIARQNMAHRSRKG